MSLKPVGHRGFLTALTPSAKAQAFIDYNVRKPLADLGFTAIIRRIENAVEMDWRLVPGLLRDRESGIALQIAALKKLSHERSYALFSFAHPDHQGVVVFTRLVLDAAGDAFRNVRQVSENENEVLKLRRVAGNNNHRLESCDASALTPDIAGPRHAAVIAEAMGRDDLGVGEMWEPDAGGGMHPAAIHASGVTSLETAAAKMEEIAAANPRLRNHASDTPTITMRLE